LSNHHRGAVVEVKVGESVSLDCGRIRITLEAKSGQRARLRILAPPAVEIGDRQREDAPPVEIFSLRRG
jgi:hypothetical protein